MPCSFHHRRPLNSRGAVRIHALLRQPAATTQLLSWCVLQLSSGCRRVVVELSSSCRRVCRRTHTTCASIQRQQEQSPYEFTLAARGQQPCGCSGRDDDDSKAEAILGATAAAALVPSSMGAKYSAVHCMKSSMQQVTEETSDRNKGTGYRNRHSQWTQLNTSGSSPSPRSGHDVVVIGSKAYLFGGCGGEQVSGV